MSAFRDMQLSVTASSEALVSLQPRLKDSARTKALPLHPLEEAWDSSGFPQPSQNPQQHAPLLTGFFTMTARTRNTAHGGKGLDKMGPEIEQGSQAQDHPFVFIGS